MWPICINSCFPQAWTELSSITEDSSNTLLHLFKFEQIILKGQGTSEEVLLQCWKHCAVAVPLNAFTLSDVLCITITHTQPCIRPWVDFYVDVNVGRSRSRWQLNSWAGPPLLRLAVCVIWQTEIRLWRDEWKPSEYAQVSWHGEKICPVHSDLMEFPIFCTAAGFCRGIFVICAHTRDTCEADAVFSLGTLCH